MDKLTYLAELAEGLARWVPERERQNILRYYAEYFEEAGPGREAEVVQELGDPWALSCRLAVEGGFVTQEQAQSWTPRKNKRKVWPLVMVAAVACVAIVAVSVGSLSARIGRFVGRNVAGLVTGEAQVMDPVQEVTFYDYGFEPVMSLPPNSIVTAVEGTAAAGGFWTVEDGNLDTFESVDVDISFGNITVTGGTDYTLAIQKEGDLGDYDLKWTVKGGTLKVEDARPGGFQSKWGVAMGEHKLDVSITVPSGARLDELDVKTNLGDIFLSDVAVEKKLDAKSNLGDVQLYGVQAQKLEAKSNLGDVECYDSKIVKQLTLKSNLGDVSLGLEELWDGMDIDLETDLGQVEANLNCRERECEYELECSLGEVRVNGQDRGDEAEQKGSCPYKLTAKASHGDVNVDFREN